MIALTGRDLRPLFEPASVVLVGASADPMKWGGWFARSLLRQDPRPRIHLVSRRGGTILGEPAYRTLADLPESPELAVLTIPAAAVPAAVDDALAAGVRAICVIAAGFGEGGAAGARVQEQLVARVRAAGAVLLGPNCLGLLDTGSGLNATGGRTRPGPVALVSQSGNVALEIGMLLGADGLGFSRFASVGNQADIGVSDVLASLVDHAPTRVAAVYVEDPHDGPAFVAALRALAALGRPVLVLPAGRSAIGARAARSHTGALAGESRVLAAAVRDGGGILVATPGELVDAARALLAGVRMRGRRVAVVADGGGHGVLAADLLADRGLEVATLGAATAARIAPELVNSEAVNPVDLAGAGERDVECFARIAAALLADDGVDGVLCSGYFGGYAGYSETAGAIEAAVAGQLADLRDATGKPLLVHSMFVPTAPPGIAVLRDRDVPTYARVESAIAALDALSAPPPAPRRAPPAPASATLAGHLAYPQARALIAGAGIAFPDGELAIEDAAVAAIAARIGGPVVCKAIAPALLHKTDSGGIALGLRSPAEAAAAAAAIRRRVALAVPGLALDGVWVERMAPAGGVDLVVGARRDPCFGAVVLVGVGGVFVEALDDVVIALAPADSDHVERLLRGLKAWPLLAGTRGAAAVDVGAIATAATILGDLLHQHPELAEIEVNPLRATASGVLALDARLVLG